MGQCYSIYLLIKVKDEQGAKNVLRSKIEPLSYGESQAEACGVDLDTLYGLLQYFYGNWGRNFKLTIDPKTWKGFTKYSSDFDASYGWESVMMETFCQLAPYLADRSSLKIYPDSGVDYFRVKDGKAVWIR